MKKLACYCRKSKDDRCSSQLKRTNKGERKMCGNNYRLAFSISFESFLKKRSHEATSDNFAFKAKEPPLDSLNESY